MRRWPLIVIVALAPLWLIGILCRGAWTPDEPREADIAWRMSLQNDRTLPHLADTAFLEKPPLSYWMSAEGLEIFGNSAAAARAPNLLYAIVTALATGALAFTAEGAAAAVVAALVAGSAITAYRVAVWLAPDACLLCGCAIGLLGAYIGFTGSRGRRKLFGYTLMHVGAAVGFMAKSAPGWLVPSLALLAIIAWERRWSELKRWELYVGFIAQALVIGPWLYEVSLTVQGQDAFRALFWDNVVGRFAKLSSPTASVYTTGHKNSPGKYFLELPVYLLPWTLIAVAALRRAWDRVRDPSNRGTPWRFAIASVAPFLILLSVAVTARDIYAAPVLLGFGLLIALWVSEVAGRELGWVLVRPAGPLVTRLDRLAVAGTLVLVAIIAVAFVVALAILAAATPGESRMTYCINAAAVIVIASIAIRLAVGAGQANAMLKELAWIYTTYVAVATIGGLALFPTIDRWQDLPALAQRIHADSRDKPLALLHPDETTIAMLDYRLQTAFTVLDPSPQLTDNTVKSWFHTQGAHAVVLVKLPGRAPGDLTRLIDHFHRARKPDDGIAAKLVHDGVATILRRYELPEGRRYALLAQADSGA